MLLRKWWRLSLRQAALDMSIDFLAKLLIQLRKALSPILDIFIKEENFAKQRIIGDVDLNRTLISFVHESFLCHS